MNKYYGDSPILIDGEPFEVDGETLVMRFGKKALEDMSTEFGQHGHLKLYDATGSCDVKVLVKGVVFALKEHHGDKFDYDKIFALNIPIRSLQTSLQIALDLAFYGPQGPPGPDPEQEGDADPMKRLKRFQNWFSRFGRKT